MSTDLTKKPPSTGTSEPQELEHQIRLRAYELYEARGRKDGRELDEWLSAKNKSGGRNFEPLPAD